jgi:hypothetical protein
MLCPATQGLAQGTDWAQRNHRADLNGLITDQSGAVLPGVIITLVNKDEGLKRETVTNDVGRFALLLLPPGRSTLTATLSGFAPHEIDNVVLNVGESLSLVIRMDLAKLGESVTVVAQPPLVSTPIAVAPAVMAPPAGPVAQPPSIERPILTDRGTGVPTSMFGTYIRKGEFIVYPFFEYYRDHDLEYNPAELGFQGDEDFRGKYRANESLIFVGYGITENLAVEFEAAAIVASLEKASNDPSLMPARLEQSGLGDVETQLRWRWAKETVTRPEFFSYGEIVFPGSKDQPLIGTPGWEFKLGTGLIRGFTWGTLTARAAVEIATESTSPFDLGEYALEYLKRLSPSWRVYAGLEGSQDELSFIGEAQWFITRNIMLKLNSGFGLTSKATDWAPEIGILCWVPTRASTAAPVRTRHQRRVDRPRPR